MKQISLSKGLFAKVDDIDFDYLSQWKWCANSNGYAVRNQTFPRKTILMHRIVTNAQGDFEVDHINGDRLDNTKSNLRICTHKQNTQNRPANHNNPNGYKGVTYTTRGGGKYDAQIKVNGKHIYLGRFSNPEDAARSYDKAAIKHFGKFAQTNFEVS